MVPACPITSAMPGHWLCTWVPMVGLPASISSLSTLRLLSMRRAPSGLRAARRTRDGAPSLFHHRGEEVLDLGAHLLASQHPVVVVVELDEEERNPPPAALLPNQPARPADALTAHVLGRDHAVAAVLIVRAHRELDEGRALEAHDRHGHVETLLGNPLEHGLDARGRHQ